MAESGIKNVVVIGAGLMGNGIAQMSLLGGFNVTLVDIKDEFVDKGYAVIEKQVKKLEGKGTLPKMRALPEDITADKLMARCKKSINLASAVKDADIVVEAIVEKMDIKKTVCKTVFDNAPSHCIFASNTSSLSITDIGKDSGAPDRVCGQHFFNPVALMKLVEVIWSKDSSQKTIDTVMQFSKEIPCLRGRRYIAEVLKDRPGFIVNRINAPVQIYMNYVFDKAAEEGIEWEAIDGDGDMMPMGPCELADYVGPDTMAHTINYYHDTLSEDFKVGKVVGEMIERGDLGRKTGKGFYDWPADGSRPKIDRTKKAGLFDLQVSMAIIYNEACRVLEEGITKSYKVIDKSQAAGMNSPGPIGTMKGDIPTVIATLEKIAKETGADYLKPCDLAKSGDFSAYK